MAARDVSSLSTSLEGVCAERGSLVFCRDAASFEMILKMNTNTYKSRLVSTVFAALAEHSPARSEGSSQLREQKLLFLHDLPGAEEEVQNWLDPFRNRSWKQPLPTRSNPKRPRTERDSSGEDDHDSDSDVDGDYDEDSDSSG